MNVASRKTIVVLGMMAKKPVAGVVWQTLHYLVGFRRLGYEVCYVEAHGGAPVMFMDADDWDGSEKAAAFLDAVMRRFDLGGSWAFVARHADGRCYGRSEVQLDRLYESAELIVNLHGGTDPSPELSASGRLVYLETDPCAAQVALARDDEAIRARLGAHSACFTFGENYGRPDCGLPVAEGIRYRPTRQPVVLDFWAEEVAPPNPEFTTIGSWRQEDRDVEFGGRRYSWSKHHEFLKYVDLPARAGQPFELALSKFGEADRAMLEGKGWKVRDALDVSLDLDRYRRYIAASRGEFTVAKEQNIRLRSGWFSDRSATYLAAGRPVITQETGFSNILPTGAGLFAFSDLDEAAAAVESIVAHYDDHRRSARAIAREYFDSDVVLSRFLEDLGVR